MKRSRLIAFYIFTFANAWGLAAAFMLFYPQMSRVSWPATSWNPIVFLMVWSRLVFGPVLARVVEGQAGLVHWAVNRFGNLGPDDALYCAIAYSLAALAAIVATARSPDIG
jgi:hypothetical protein